MGGKQSIVANTIQGGYMEIDRARWLIKGYSERIGSTYAEAVKVVDEYIKDLEKKVNNKEKVILIDQEELCIIIKGMYKRLNNERNKLERDYNKTGLINNKTEIKNKLKYIDTKQETYMEIINLIKEL